MSSFKDTVDKDWKVKPRYSVSWYQKQIDAILKLKDKSLDKAGLQNCLQDLISAKYAEIDFILYNYMRNLISAVLTKENVHTHFGTGDPTHTYQYSLFLQEATLCFKALRAWANSGDNGDLISEVKDLLQVAWKRLLKEQFYNTRFVSYAESPWTFEELLMIESAECLVNGFNITHHD